MQYFLSIAPLVVINFKYLKENKGMQVVIKVYNGNT